MSRLRNLMVTTIRAQVLLLKLIVIVIDDDLIQFIKDDLSDDTAWSVCYHKLLNNIMTEYDHVIEAHKDNLQIKSKKWNYPHMIWIMPPFHDNFRNSSQCIILEACMEAVAKFHSNTIALELKKVWNPHNMNLFAAESNRFTAAGYTAYWNAVNKTIKYGDTILQKKLTKKQQFHTAVPNRDRYRWTNKNQYAFAKDGPFRRDWR